MKQPARAWALTFLILSLALLGSPTRCPAKEVKRCHMCGMNAAASQTEFVLSFDDGSTEHTCCLHCVFLLQKLMKDRRVSAIRTRNFTSGALIEAKTALYLEGSSLIPRGSMAPFLLAFAERKQAEKYRAKYGGAIVGYDGAMALVEKFDAEVGPIR